MYILASFFSLEKDDKYVFKARNSFVCREFLAFKYVFIIFFREKRDDYLHQKSWKLAFKISFSVHNIHLYLCWHVENTKCVYLRFLMYKKDLSHIKYISKKIRWLFILVHRILVNSRLKPDFQYTISIWICASR